MTKLWPSLLSELHPTNVEARAAKLAKARNTRDFFNFELMAPP
jgi:hypothetical protein